MARKQGSKSRNSRQTQKAAIAPGNSIEKSQESPINSQTVDFVNGLSGVLTEMTALEVNTIVVEEITGHKFIPWESYRDIYEISPNWLEQSGIHPSLRDRYLDLRRNLEREYTMLLSNPDSALYDAQTADLDRDDSLLPNPFQAGISGEIVRVQQLLSDSRFLRNLRKQAELKVCWDRRNRALQRLAASRPDLPPGTIAKAIRTDLIYAQTTIQLDGDIINRYSEDAIAHPHRDTLLRIHHDSVEAGERQWRGILGFVLEILQTAFGSRDRG
ncbi:MAG: hypothetical protein SAJ12_07145 [Jaaginema sp. PMC 1079.18]|nr:hypothetical protein [Jaaginema sp. PMC 1080.18]MEC4850772.1 hypothetical protein [Jaaginema sp. PMC 1079.18]MEC4866998.1 hypothetical protein [Jaaginema sp. PMC 1078.18]